MSQLVIIGAGASGLMAAKILLEKGHEVTIVEARGRTGGRINTLQNGFSRPVEAGAEFIHGKLPITFSLLKQAGAKKILRKGNPYTFLNGQPVPGNLWDEKWQAMLEELKRLTTDVDIASFLQQHFGTDEFKDLRQQVQRFAEGFDLADITRVSAMALREEWLHHDDDHQYHVEGGYQVLINVLESDVKRLNGKIILASPVMEIQWKHGYVRAITESGMAVDGERMVITVPLGVLQSGVIKFNPALPRYQDAFRQMGFGDLIKFMFEFKSPFWEQLQPPLKNMSFLFSDAEVPTWWTQLPDTVPLLTGWLGGPNASAAPRDRQKLYALAIRSLAYLFRCHEDAIESQLMHWHIADWTDDQYSLGAYAYPTVQGHVARALITQPVDATLYFAGEALYEGSEMGTVEAALISGREVAERLDKA